MSTSSARPDATLLQVERLTKVFRRRGLASLLGGSRGFAAVDGVSFELDMKQTLAVVGESGCGKSTLARTVLRLLEPDGGTVRFEGQLISEFRGAALRRFRSRAQIVFQDPFGSLNPRLTVGELICEPLRATSSVSAAEAARRTAELLRQVGLPEDAARRFPHAFSGGQRQRIAIARALSTDPQLLICDEAVSALDVSIRAQILNLLEDLKARLGFSVLFISHDLSVVRHVADRVAVMYLGQIVEEAETDALFSRPLHPYTSLLLSSVPLPNPRVARAALAAARIEADEPPNPNAPPSGCRFRTRCPHAVAQCAAESPPLRDVAGGHKVACWRAGEAGVADLSASFGPETVGYARHVAAYRAAAAASLDLQGT